MKRNNPIVRVNQDVIELYDIVMSDTKIEDYYRQANEILLTRYPLEKKLGTSVKKNILKMRISYLNSR